MAHHLAPSSAGRAGPVSRSIISAAAGIIAAAGLGMPAQAQPVLWLTGGAVNIQTNGLADDWIVPGVAITNCMVGPGLNPGQNGFDFGLVCNRNAIQKDPKVPTFAQAITKPRLFVDGNGTNCIVISWDSYSWARSGAAEGYFARCDSLIDAVLTIEPDGVPPGTPLEISYRIDVWGAAFSRLDACPAQGLPKELPGPPPPDFVDWRNSATIDGVQLLDPVRYNVYLPTGPFVGNIQWDNNKFHGLPAAVGTPITVQIDSFIESQISFWGRGAFCGKDNSSGSIQGTLTICVHVPGQPPMIQPPPGAPGPLPDSARPIFSLDIGSANCLSDPTGLGVGRFDVGDAYRWFGPPLPPGGANGVVDDAMLIGFDLTPTPGVPTPLPYCSGLLPGDPGTQGVFNLDAIDRINLDIHQILSNATPGFPVMLDPADPATGACLHRPEHLFISFDDDGAHSYLGDPVTGQCDWPSIVPSSLGATYGSDADKDEVIGLVVFPGVIGAPGTALAQYPVLSESDLHVSRGPSPTDPDQTHDNDVNALDITPSVACNILYFSSDHAAPGFDINGNQLRPGVIYQATTAGPIEAVVPEIHLGIHPDTDINAIEFVIADFDFPPPSTAVETEVCIVPIPTVDFFNGGCNSPFPVFDDLELHQTMAGTTGDDGSSRDTDWYRIIAPIPGDYTLTIDAAGDAVAGFIGSNAGPLANPSCGPGLVLNPFVTGIGANAVTAHLPTPGEYWIFVSTNGWNNQGCFDYTLVVEPPSVQTGPALALLFSVDQDDPATIGIDESGGLEPGQIYISFLNGVSFPFLDTPLDDNIDAIAAWAHPLNYSGNTPVTPVCLGDLNADGVIDADDLGILLAAFGTTSPIADLNADGVVDADDLGILLAVFGTVCP